MPDRLPVDPERQALLRRAIRYSHSHGVDVGEAAVHIEAMDRATAVAAALRPVRQPAPVVARPVARPAPTKPATATFAAKRQPREGRRVDVFLIGGAAVALRR